MTSDKEAEVAQLVAAAFKRANGSQSYMTEDDIEKMSIAQTNLIIRWGKNHSEFRSSLVAVIVVGSTLVDISNWAYDDKTLLHIFAFQEAIATAEMHNHIRPFTAIEANEMEIHRQFLYELLNRIDILEAEIKAETSIISSRKKYNKPKKSIDNPTEIVKVFLYTISIAAAIYLLYRYFPI